MKNPLTHKATQLAKAISSQYELLGIEDPSFFETYHDNMLIQKDCAWDTVGEVEYYENKGEAKFATATIEQLKKTLEYCKAVIKLQEATIALPECIFG